MDKLKILIDECACSVALEINEHKDCYQSVEEYLDIMESCKGFEINDDIKSIMIETNTIITLQFYPKTPVSFYSICHYDLDKALDEALEALSYS